MSKKLGLVVTALAGLIAASSAGGNGFFYCFAID
jgi:hypothetical protein